MEHKVVLPEDNKPEKTPEVTHMSIVEAGLAQLDTVMQEQEEEIKKLNEAAANLQQRRIAAIAQKNLLEDLKEKFKPE
jgi:predicted AAA+ superfamily ATPase